MIKWQKYGIKIPKTVHHALAIDNETGTDFWHQVLKVKMTQIFLAINILHVTAGRPVDTKKYPVKLFSMSKWISHERPTMWLVVI